VHRHRAQRATAPEVKGAGHYGIFSGRRWREVVYPEVKKFILAHQPVPAPTATQASESEPSITPTRPAATKKAAKKPAAAKPTAAAQPVGTVAEASLAAPTPTRSKAVTNKKAVLAKRTPATASGKTAPRTARGK
jgi:poly(3-hydroxybutyrate) depolymerase